MKKNIVIVVLCLCVVLVLGFMFYSFNEKDKKVTELKGENTTLKNQVSNLNAGSGVLGKFVGKYEYVKKVTDTIEGNAVEATIYFQLEIKNDGTGTSKHGAFGDGITEGYSEAGDVSINSNKIYVMNDDCVNDAYETNGVGNCHLYYTYSYNGDKISADYGDTKVELKKVSEFTKLFE